MTVVGEQWGGSLTLMCACLCAAGDQNARRGASRPERAVLAAVRSGMLRRAKSPEVARDRAASADGASPEELGMARRHNSRAPSPNYQDGDHGIYMDLDAHRSGRRQAGQKKQRSQQRPRPRQEQQQRRPQPQPQQPRRRREQHRQTRPDGDLAQVEVEEHASTLHQQEQSPVEALLEATDQFEFARHAAAWVAKHGTGFEDVLRKKHVGEPGWEFLGESSEQLTRYPDVLSVDEMRSSLLAMPHRAQSTSFSDPSCYMTPAGQYYHARLALELAHLKLIGRP